MIATAISVMTGVAAAMLAAAALLTLLRLSRGPTTLDRVVSSDVLVTAVVAVLALVAVARRDGTTLSVMLVLSLLSFAGTISVARGVADRAEHDFSDDNGSDADEQRSRP